MKAEERVYLNKDKTKAVREDHKGRASLLAAPGQDIPKEYEGLVKKMRKTEERDRDEKPTRPPKLAPDGESPQDDNKKDAGNPPENKEIKTGDNKDDNVGTSDPSQDAGKDSENDITS